MGLGDRHVQNILVDCNTAELIHIDLGENYFLVLIPYCLNTNEKMEGNGKKMK